MEKVKKKIAVIGANGNLGSRVTKRALDSGYSVKAIIYMGECLDNRAEILEKSLFDLTKEDLKDVDVVISAFGGGFNSDPAINKQAYLQYINLLGNTDIKLVAIAGAGCLYIDSTHSLLECEAPNHPKKLVGISKNILLGVKELEKINTFNWTAVCPSRKFDLEGPYTGDYIVGTDCEIIYNEDGESYLTYEDMAKAMIDISESEEYNQKLITVATKTLK